LTVDSGNFARAFFAPLQRVRIVWGVFGEAIFAKTFDFLRSIVFLFWNASADLSDRVAKSVVRDLWNKFAVGRGSCQRVYDWYGFREPAGRMAFAEVSGTHDLFVWGSRGLRRGIWHRFIANLSLGRGPFGRRIIARRRIRSFPCWLNIWCGHRIPLVYCTLPTDLVPR